MKKLSIILLALALAATMAVPAMAGDISADGSYMLRGRSDSNGSDSAFFQHELDLNIDVTSGDVKFHWDIELADVDLFDGTGLGTNNEDVSGDEPKGIWDGFYVQWKASDALTFKAGIYGVSDNNTVMFYSAGNGDGIMGIMYKLDMVSLGAYLSKQTDDRGNDNEDITEMLFTAKGDLGPAAVSLMYGSRTDETTDNNDDSALYLDAAFDAGPVGMTIAYGSATADDGDGDGGTIIILTADLSDLVGFDLGLTMHQTNEDWEEGGGGFGNDYGYAELMDCDEEADWMTVGLEAGYSVNDNLSLSALAVLLSDAGDAGDGPTEIDVALKYALADNVTYKAGYAARSEGDVGSDKTRLWHRIDFKF